MPELKKIPQETQSQILYYLESNNFLAARELYNQFYSGKIEQRKNQDATRPH